MPGKMKGSRPEEQLVPITEAAKMVGLTVRSLHSMVERGIIEAIHPPKKGPKHFRVHDLAALAEARTKRSLDFNAVADLATQAYVTAKSNARRLDDLYYLLGFDTPILETSEEEVVALFVRAQEAKGHTRDLPAEAVHEWAGTLYSIDEKYLDLVIKHTATEEPWCAFIDLANAFITDMPADSFSSNPPLKSAYAYMSIARTNLRTVSYYFCRHRIGIAAAAKAFRNDESDPTAAIVRLMFPSMSTVFGSG